MANINDGEGLLLKVARECGVAADAIVHKRQFTQADMDDIVMLLRRAEKTMIDAHVVMRLSGRSI